MDNTFFSGNRESLLNEVGRGALIVLAGYHDMQRAHDSTHLFEQEANFLYLSGIKHPGWRLIIDGKRKRTYVVAPKLSRAQEVFDGSLSLDAAKKISGAQEAIDYDEADSLLIRLSREHQLVYSVNETSQLSNAGFSLNPAQRELGEYLSHRFKSVRQCGDELSSLRAIKQPEEIKALKRAVNISVDSFQAVKKNLEIYKYEYEIEAKLGYDFRRSGSSGHAYSPIVAGGGNACTLHYVANNDRLAKRNLVLIDAGASFLGYAADITRTYALGEAAKRQVEVYSEVLNIQKECIRLCKPDTVLGELQKTAETLTMEALKRLGLYKDVTSIHQYFPHAIGHGLGIDVHDGLGKYDRLEAGMVITIEPGIYIPKENIGVRIEDDILITETGHLNLSGKLSTDL